MAHYGTLEQANEFFANRLHSWDWDQATSQDKVRALTHASQLIDQFSYWSQKYSVQQVINAAGDGCPSSEAITEADQAQELEFPRGNSDVVPIQIERACYLIAKALLSGRDPDFDKEALANSSVAYGGVRSSYNGNRVMDHIAHNIPSAEAFHLIMPYFREKLEFELKRV